MRKHEISEMEVCRVLLNFLFCRDFMFYFDCCSLYHTMVCHMYM